ncbi:glycosyltransferase [Mesorhizobium sp. RMAD-H1]|uniref:glycosyltransferase n=1 Tax=Mesorhizobium sp. RMAD-H1 TaxID=2587065 RepID=UPI001609B7F4|nr:glycosyltransferase [Mesorhizobium sp. RMAD-H1]MBB2970500.1 glycosyltransferase involved in cell wall biosynthesis [Mesorhizobium sp. RMAD-H1]
MNDLSGAFTDGKRIALFIRALKGNGAERSTLNLGRALAERGIPVDLLLVEAEGEFLSEIPDTVRLVELKRGSTAGALPLLLRRPRDLLGLLSLVFVPHSPKPLGAIPGLVRYLRTERPAALLSALDYANIAAIIAADIAATGTRVVISQRNHFSSEMSDRRAWRARFACRVFRRFYSRAARVVAVSESVADDLAKACDLPRGQVVTVYNAVAGPVLDAKAAEPVDHPWFVPDAPPVVLGVGKLKPQKDFPTLLRAFALLRREREVRLMILGEGPGRAALETLARELGVAGDVALPGFVANPFPYMANAGLFVLSSTFEGLPGVLVQALACGCPVVSTDCPGGSAEILEHGRYGPLTPVGDAEALARAMKATLDAPLDRKLLKERGNFFSPDRAVDGYLDVLLATRLPRAQALKGR